MPVKGTSQSLIRLGKGEIAEEPPARHKHITDAAQLRFVQMVSFGLKMLGQGGY